MRSLEELDRWIASKVKRLATNVAGAPHRKELLEVRRDILDEIRAHIQPKGSGKYLFPYNSLVITTGSESGVEQDVRELLTQAGCALPAIDALVDPALTGLEPPFRIEYLNRKPPIAKRPAAKLVVIHGAAEPREYSIASNLVNLGRLKEVTGDKQGLRRRNHIAFPESETTVSREHAYIRFDEAAGKFRICDYQSTRGTSVFREGRRIEVPHSSPRGVRLEAGDEIHLGEARIRFEIEEA